MLKKVGGGGEDMAVVFSLTLFIFCNYCFIQEYIFFGKQIQKVSSHSQKLIAWFKRECQLEVFYVKKSWWGGGTWLLSSPSPFSSFAIIALFRNISFLGSRFRRSLLICRNRLHGLSVNVIQRCFMLKKKLEGGRGEDMTVVFSLTLFILCNYCFHLTKIW